MSSEPPLTDFDHVELTVARYRSNLTPREVGRGILASQRNARRLLMDALTLLEHGRYAGAIQMAVLAHEETAKPITIGMAGAFDFNLKEFPIATAMSPKDVAKRIWFSFENHTLKNLRAAGFLRSSSKAVDNQDIADSFVRLRERATYVDCVQGSERWTLPERAINRDIAINMVRMVRVTIGKVLTPDGAAEGFGQHPLARLFGNNKRLDALLEWSASPEAGELTRVALAETTAWGGEVDRRIELIQGKPSSESGTDPTTASSG